MVLEIRIPRDNEYTPEAAAALFNGFTKTLTSPSFLDTLLGRKTPGTTLSLETVFLSQQIRFFAVFDDGLLSAFESQLLAAYPSALITQTEDYLPQIKLSSLKLCQMALSAATYYPLKTYQDFRDTDPLASLWAVMSKGSPQDFFLCQILLTKDNTRWQTAGQKAVEIGIPLDNEGHRRSLPGENLIRQKTSEIGLRAGLRLAAASSSQLSNLAGAFAAFNRGDGNSLAAKKPSLLNQNLLLNDLLYRRTRSIPRFQAFSISELATLWHLPNQFIRIPNIAWGRSILYEAPENLPIADGLSEDEKKTVCFLGRTEFRNRTLTFGIKDSDRRRHVYTIGKTGTGKSTLIANMAIDDMKKDRGVAVIDPHGDLCEILLDYVPSRRINDVCYFNPADRDNPIALNILETKDSADTELVTSGIISIFSKLYANSWGPRLEYILRNTIITLANIPDSTLVDVLPLLSDQKFRQKIVARLQDPVLINFWQQEFEKMPDRLQKESISPIQNKVGQFVTSPLIRSIIGQPHSSVSLEEIMETNKILLVNLSQGKLGEDNSALLGAMIITRLQQTAMHRVNVPEEERRDFYLYVDEFQNFATRSFIKILSEARKYRLNLTLANQYMAQIDPEVQKAIFGNAGSLFSFVVGADDGYILEKEFGATFTQKNLVALDRFQIACKLTIDQQVAQPFLGYTLPLPASKNQNRDKILRNSREKYAFSPKTLAANKNFAPVTPPPPAQNQPSSPPVNPNPLPKHDSNHWVNPNLPRQK